MTLQEELDNSKQENKFTRTELRNSDFPKRYEDRFKKSMCIENLYVLLQRIEDPDLMKKQYQQQKKNIELRKQQGLPPRTKIKSSNNTADLLSKYPLIVVIGDIVAGYENEEQIKDAIIASKLSTDMMKIFEVKERTIKSQLIIEIN